MPIPPPTIPHADWCHEEDRPGNGDPCRCDDDRRDLSDAIFADLAGIKELSDELGVPRQTICNWAAGRARIGFPVPLLRLGATPIWSRSVVKSWYKGEVR